MNLFVVTGSIDNIYSVCHSFGKSQRWDAAWIHVKEIFLCFTSLQLWSFPCCVGQEWIKQKGKLDKIAAAQASQGVSRKATKSLTQPKCYLTSPDTSRMLKEKQGFKSQLCKGGAVIGEKEKKVCPGHSAQKSLPHLYSSVQSRTSVPWASTVLSVNRNFSILCKCLEIEADTNLGRNTCFRSRFTLQGPKIHWGLKLHCYLKLELHFSK